MEGNADIFRETPKKGRYKISAKIWHPRFSSSGSASGYNCRLTVLSAERWKEFAALSFRGTLVDLSQKPEASCFLSEFRGYKSNSYNLKPIVGAYMYIHVGSYHNFHNF